MPTPFVKISKRVVEEAATSGHCVIVGRGSQHFLRYRDDTLRFFLYGSKEEKIRRLISEGQKEADAQVLVDTVDRERALLSRTTSMSTGPTEPFIMQWSILTRETKL